LTGNSTYIQNEKNFSFIIPKKFSIIKELLSGISVRVLERGINKETEILTTCRKEAKQNASPEEIRLFF